MCPVRKRCDKANVGVKRKKAEFSDFFLILPFECNYFLTPRFKAAMPVRQTCFMS